jgi:hypothetical protein
MPGHSMAPALRRWRQPARDKRAIFPGIGQRLRCRRAKSQTAGADKGASRQSPVSEGSVRSAKAFVASASELRQLVAVVYRPRVVLPSLGETLSVALTSASNAVLGDPYSSFGLVATLHQIEYSNRPSVALTPECP